MYVGSVARWMHHFASRYYIIDVYTKHLEETLSSFLSSSQCSFSVQDKAKSNVLFWGAIGCGFAHKA